MSDTNGTLTNPPQWERGLPVTISCIPGVADGEEQLSATTTTTSAATSSSNTTTTTTPSSNHQALTLLFGYEFAIIDPRESVGGEVIQQDLPSLEYNLLYHVADAIGLLNCHSIIDKQRSIFLQQQSLPLTAVNDGAASAATTPLSTSSSSSSRDEMPLVIGLSNLQPDEWESEIGAYPSYVYHEPLTVRVPRTHDGTVYRCCCCCFIRVCKIMSHNISSPWHGLIVCFLSQSALNWFSCPTT
jgi:hypothetical protein